MKATIVVLTILLLVTLVAAKKKISVEEHKFIQFQHEFDKQYASQDYAAKFATFKSNLKRIDSLNKAASERQSSATFGVNEYADLSVEEFAKYYLTTIPNVRDGSESVAADLPVDDLPDSFDWNEKGAVTAVKNQGLCGGCWSFSATGNVEGQWFLAGNNLTGLSEQNLLDCDHECRPYLNGTTCDDGCGGGLQPNAYEYIIKNGGIDTEESYPYTSMLGKSCRFKPDNIGAKISNWTWVSSNETQMAAYLVANGPLAIAADANDWQFYIGGVFDIPCGSILTHGILITGFGSETNDFGHIKPYWIVKNSWGEVWGEKGFFKILRGSGECALNTFVTSTIV
eukprot:gene10924-12731_t